MDRTRFRVNIYPPMPWVRRLPEVVALRSSTFGDLLDPANPGVKDSTCPERRGLTYCEFTAAVKGAPGTTVTETVSLELTDRTGPTNTITASTDVVVPVPPVREPTAWAARDAAWPEPTVDGITIARSTRPSDVFFLSRKCERRLPSTLEDLLTVEPMGACALQWRLTRAATAAALDEAARADLYPAESVQAVVDRTNAALVTGKRKQLERLTRTFEEWNEGRSPR